MPAVSTLLILYVLGNGLMSLLFMRVTQTEFRRRGHWSKPVAVWSGAIMHGHALATWALAWLDRGSLYEPGLASMTAGLGLFAAGAVVIGLGRRAYGSQERVYGLLEDTLIERGIYRVTRNPQYVGYAGMFLGAAMAAGSGYALASSLLFAVFVHGFITRVEEPHLKRVFGEPYLAYCGRVRRYL